MNNANKIDIALVATLCAVIVTGLISAGMASALLAGGVIALEQTHNVSALSA